MLNDPFPYFDCLSQQQIGQLFGVSSQQVGQWLIALGLRSGKAPKPDCLLSGLAIEVVSGDMRFFTWKKEEIVHLLERAGHQRPGSPEPTTDLPKPKPSKPVGPFVVRRKDTSADLFEIVGSDGEASIWAIGESLAGDLAAILNLCFEKRKFFV